ncbi:MAG: hypothetical protein ACR2RA_10245 [Geminicoccaceae bacterium]
MTGVLGWAILAFTTWHQRQAQEGWKQTRHQLEDQLAFHDAAQRRLRATNTSLNHQLAWLKSEIDQLVAAHGVLASVLDRQVLASGQLSEMEAKREATEITVATLALQQEVLKSRHAASRAMLARRSQFDGTEHFVATDAEEASKVSSPMTTMAAIGEGLYAFASLKVPRSSTLNADDVLISKSTTNTKVASDRTAHASGHSIAATFIRIDDSPGSLSATNWADAQFELGKSLASRGRRRSGTRQLQEAVLAFKAAAGEWSHSQVPLKWAAVHFELGRTLALLSQRSGNPAFRTASIKALNDSLSVSSEAGVVTSATEARRLLDELNTAVTNAF